MNSQVAGRYQRARGLKLKRALQFTTLLAICIWLLYQIIHPHDKSYILGRKVNMGWLIRGNKPDLEEGKIIDKPKNWGETDGENEDDQLAKRREENANDNLNEISVLADDDKDDQQKFEMQWKDLHASRAGVNAAILNEERDKNERHQNLRTGVEIDGKKQEIVEETYSKGIKGKVARVLLPKKKDEHHLALELEHKDALSTDNLWQHGNEHGVVHGSGFEDENGVPLGFNDIAESKGH